MALQLPARIGKYELQEFLGGGMSHVYRAQDTVIGRTVAVKILTEEGCADAEAKARFLQEARLAGNLQHDNVLHIYDFGEDDQKRPYMVMEFLRGEDLRHAIRDNRVGDLRNRLQIALQIARAIGFIHSQNIIHRDIKPENIHITPAGAVKLMDFGIAKTAGLSMTRTGYVMGTPYYMAPEQVLGKNIGAPVDIYAFGVLFFELLVGARPFSGDTVERIFYSILHEPLDLEPLARADVPAGVRDLIARSTAKNPAARPASFAEVAAEIEAILAQMEAPDTASTPAAGTAAAAEPQPAVKPKPWVAIGAAVAVVLAIAVGVLVYLQRSRAPETAKKAATESAQPAPVLSPTLSTPTAEMVLVPAGPFLSGKDLQPVTLPAYYIDQTEVTNAAYQSFCQATGHALPKGFTAGRADYPVVNVTIEDARQFAQWAGKRLPTGQEWEKAARGTQGWPYPWGKEKDPTRANVADNPQLPKHELMPARAFENGASPFHAQQMVGNAWEFVDEPAAPTPEAVRYYEKLLGRRLGPEERWYWMRGESYGEPLGDVVDDATRVPASFAGDRAGFRCVKAAPAR